MTFLKLGFRNLFRQRRRTVVTLIVITFGIGCLLLTIGHSLFITWGLQETTIHSETGHLQLFHADYFTKEETSILQYGLENLGPMRDKLLELPDIKLVLARIDFMGLISNGNKSVACVGTGVEYKLEKKLRTIFSNTGSMYDSLIVHGHQNETVILGKGLAHSLDTKIGDWLTLMATTADGALNAVDVQVVDTFDAGISEYDKRAIIIPLRTAQILLHTEKVQKLLILLDETWKTDDYYNRIPRLAHKNGYPVAIKKWHEQASFYKQVRQFYFQITGFISIVLFLIVFFSISNTVVMSILERTREIGTLLSIGTSRWQTLKMFFFEGIFMGILGGLCSGLFAVIASSLINYFNIYLPPPPFMTEGYPLMIRNDLGLYFQIFGVTVIVATFSSLGPALRVNRMKIVDALRYI